MAINGTWREATTLGEAIDLLNAFAANFTDDTPLDGILQLRLVVGEDSNVYIDVDVGQHH